jgi:DNA-binding MarR family transcriptional regulator
MSNRPALPFEITLQVRDSCLCLYVQRAARALARRFDDALRPLGLTNGQFSLMMSLNRPNPPSMKEVAALLSMDRTTLTANLKPVERRQLVKVTADPADRRSRLMSLTPAGQNLLAAAYPLWQEAHATLEKHLSGADLDQLRAALAALS